MSNLSFRIANMRAVTFKGVLAFTDIVFGVEDNGEFTGLFVVRDFAVKNTKDGGYWLQSPGKLKTQKDGSPVMKDGYKQYQDYFDLYMAEGLGKDGGYGAPKAAWDFKRQLIAAAAKAYESLGSTKSPKPTSVAAGISDEVDPGTPFDDFDGDLPF